MTPLRGIKVVELAGLAPSPFCGMVLSDFGASVIRVDRAGSEMNYDVTARGKRSIAINLKQPEGANVLKKMCRQADVLIEPFRRGVMEKLSLGPLELLQENPRLIYARLTGYGQIGPYASMAGHDINYLAISGVLSRLGRKEDTPHAPVNLLADFAGGGLTCAMGIMAALFERQSSGQGQVIDANMVEGAAYLGSWLYRSQKLYVWGKNRGQNALDGGLHSYDTYKTKDDRYVAVGALEPHFYARLLEGLGMTPEDLPQMGNPDDSRLILAQKFSEKTRAEWIEIFDGTDACVTPIMELDEAPHHAHNKEREAFGLAPDGQYCPVPAPRLSRTPAVANFKDPEPEIGQHSVEILKEMGLSSKDINNLIAIGAVECNTMKSQL